VALFLPPLARRDTRRTTLDLARDGERRATDVSEAVRRVNAYVDVNASRAARLHPPDATEISEHLAHDAGYLDDLLPTDARHRIEVDAELVGVLEIGRARRVWVEVDAAQVDDPRELRGAFDDDLLRRAPGWKAKRHRLDPIGPFRGSALLEERGAVGPVDEALQRHGPVAYPAHGSVGDGHVVPDEIELRVTGVAEVDLARVRDDDLPTRDVQDLALYVLHLE